MKSTIMDLFEMIPDGISENQRDKKKRKSPSGSPTNCLIFSSYMGSNSEVFPLILDLFVPKGSIVADVTYGKGCGCDLW